MAYGSWFFYIGTITIYTSEIYNLYINSNNIGILGVPV